MTTPDAPTVVPVLAGTTRFEGLLELLESCTGEGAANVVNELKKYEDCKR